jgi:predicted Zn-dependent peptidase
MKYELTKLKNGTRLLTMPMPGVKSLTTLVLFGVGSRYEDDKIAGLSHFLEHMHFKGSAKRPTAMQISETVDSVGGEMNAFTSKEYTGYYIKVDGKHGELALDVLSDMLQTPLLDQEEITRECGVITEEIKMYEDQPMAYVGELFEEHLFGKNDLGRQTIGSRASVAALSRNDFLQYRQTHYNPANAVIVLAGDITQVENKVDQYFNATNDLQPPKYVNVAVKNPEKSFLMHTKETEQTHLWLGFKAISSEDPDRYILKIISTILGGGMSSRLFMQVRERRGLAYYVRCHSELYLDNGYMVASAGVTTEKFDEAVSAILAEMKNIRDTKVDSKELQKAKEYLKGKMALNLENSENVAEMAGLQEILHKEILTPEQIAERYDAVSADDILRVAQQIITNNHLTLAAISSVDNSEWLGKNLSL